jgi:hypothetical protein
MVSSGLVNMVVTNNIPSRYMSYIILQIAKYNQYGIKPKIGKHHLTG